MRYITILISCLVLASCEPEPETITSPLTVTPTGPQPVALSQAAQVDGWSGVIGRWGAGYNVYDDEGNPRLDVTYKVYMRSADGRPRHLIGIDRHPFTVPITNDRVDGSCCGPCCDPDMGGQITNNGLWVWTFVLDHIISPPANFVPETNGVSSNEAAMLDIEVWHQGRMISTRLGLSFDPWPTSRRYSKYEHGHQHQQ